MLFLSNLKWNLIIYSILITESKTNPQHIIQYHLISKILRCFFLRILFIINFLTSLLSAITKKTNASEHATDDWFSEGTGVVGCLEAVGLHLGSLAGVHANVSYVLGVGHGCSGFTLLMIFDDSLKTERS